MNLKSFFYSKRNIVILFAVTLFLYAMCSVFLSSYEGVRKCEMPDLQTLMDQTKERYGM